jgi:hypothetical protein
VEEPVAGAGISISDTLYQLIDELVVIAIKSIPRVSLAVGTVPGSAFQGREKRF